MSRRDGFSLVEALLIVVVVVIIGAVGYLAYTNLYAPKDASTNDSSSTESTQSVKIEDTKDLDVVDKQLDELNVDDSESGQLDTAAASFN